MSLIWPAVVLLLGVGLLALGFAALGEARARREEEEELDDFDERLVKLELAAVKSTESRAETQNRLTLLESKLEANNPLPQRKLPPQMLGGALR